MPQKERLSEEREQDYKSRCRKNTQQSSEPVLNEDEGISPAIDLSASTPITQLADWLASAGSAQQIADNVISLQQSYGNATVQRILGRLQDSPSVPQQTINDPIQIERSRDRTGISLKISALINGAKDAPEEDETPLTGTWTRKLGGLSDAIDPAVINVPQQTIAGGATIPGNYHGYTEITTRGDIQVVPHRGFWGTNYEVTATLDIRYNWAVQSLGKPDIINANSPEVTEDTWWDIVNDLTPSGDSIPRSPRRTYWCSDLSAIHEQYHAIDYTNAFNNFRPLEQAWLGQQTTRSRAGAYNKGDQALLQLRARVISYMGEGDFAPREARAYGAGAPLYEARACDIQTRAENEGWAEEIMTEVEEEETAGGAVAEEGEEEESIGTPVCEEETEWERETEEEEIGGPVCKEGVTEEEEEEEAVGGAVCEEEEEEEWL